MFFYTTSTHRAALPVDDLVLKSDTFQSAVQIRVPVYLKSDRSLDIQSIQSGVDAILQSEWDVKDVWGIQLIQAGESSPDPLKDYVVDVAFDGKDSPEIVSTSKASKIHVTCEDCIVKELFKLFVGQFRNEVKTILNIVNNIEERNKHHEVAVPHSSTYNIVFNLFVENGVSVDWEIEQAVAAIQPIFDILKHYANFKVSSQIQFHTKLHTSPVFDNKTNLYVVPSKDLSTFINYGEWNLITHDIYSTINFIVFFPASNLKGHPLLLEHSNTNSFIVPQWGGLYIFNTPKPIIEGFTYTLRQEQWTPIFETFASQLLELIGVPKEPKSLLMRIDSFHRIMVVKNLKHSLENLASLITLSDSLREISIPEATRSYMESSLLLYEKALEGLRAGDFDIAVEYSSQGLTDSDKAFFEKEMVQQAYFPSEHKLAVFLPLLGPLSAIVLFGVIGVVKELSKEKKEKEKALKEKKET